MVRRFALLFLLVGPSMAVEAQTPAPSLVPRVLKGRVLSGATRQPLVGAEVVLMDLGRLVQTGPTGAFAIEVPAAPYRLQVRRIGYLAKAFRFRTRADTMEVEFLLMPSAVTLDSLTVTGKPTFVSARLQGFERRRLVSATGQFLGPDELAAHRDQRMGDALRHVRGIRIAPLGGFGQSAVSMRGNAGFDPNNTTCHMAVWLDGQLISTPGRPFDLDTYLVERMAAVEIYLGPAETPMEFDAPGNGCGAIVMWTRER
jgi:hypothetical protein